MKTSTKVIIHCHLHRWLISESLNEGKPLLDFTKEHMRRCHSCSEYMKTSAAVAEKLEAKAESVDYPPHLHSRIMANIRYEGARRYRQLVFWKPAFALVAAVALLLSAVIFVTQSKNSNAGVPKSFLAELSEVGLPGMVDVIQAETVSLDSRVEDFIGAPMAAEAELIKQDLASISGNIGSVISSFEQLVSL